MIRLLENWSRQTASEVARGRDAYERADYAAAFKEWSAAAALGDPEASYRLGLLYARGHGVLANLADAAACYQRAAAQGHAEAQHQLSLLHLDGYRVNRWTSFARWYEAAAQRDSAAAEPNVHRRHVFGSKPNSYDVMAGLQTPGVCVAAGGGTNSGSGDDARHTRQRRV